jgi:hypothetical protein
LTEASAADLGIVAGEQCEQRSERQVEGGDQPPQHEPAEHQRRGTDHDLDQAEDERGVRAGHADDGQDVGHRVGVAHFGRPGDEQQPGGQVGE